MMVDGGRSCSSQPTRPRRRKRKLTSQRRAGCSYAGTAANLGPPRRIPNTPCIRCACLHPPGDVGGTADQVAHVDGIGSRECPSAGSARLPPNGGGRTEEAGGARGPLRTATDGESFEGEADQTRVGCFARASRPYHGGVLVLRRDRPDARRPCRGWPSSAQPSSRSRWLHRSGRGPRWRGAPPPCCCRPATRPRRARSSTGRCRMAHAGRVPPPTAASRSLAGALEVTVGSEDARDPSATRW